MGLSFAVSFALKRIRPFIFLRREMTIVVHLIARPENVSTKVQLVDAVYGAVIHVSDRTVDSHLRNLRGKLAEAGGESAISTVHGVGIRMGPCENR